MTKSQEHKGISKGYKRLIISVYLGLMLLFYLGFVLLANYRFSPSRQINPNNPADLQSFQQLGF